jgi:hypothetical protein
MMKKLAISLCFILASGKTFAEVNVCLDKAGKKVFSDVACEKRGLQVSTADFPVVTKDSVQPVYVVTPASASVQESEIPVKASQPGKTEKRASPWSSDLPLPRFALFFIALMPLAAALFLAFHLVLFIKARLRKYRHVRSSMEK